MVDDLLMRTVLHVAHELLNVLRGILDLFLHGIHDLVLLLHLMLEGFYLFVRLLKIVLQPHILRLWMRRRCCCHRAAGNVLRC